MTLPLKNKLALVTGASGGIGSAVAKRLARDGASVLVHYGSSRQKAETVARAINDSGGAAEVLGADLARHDGPQKLIAQLDGAFGGDFAGRLDILVNNAGSFAFGGLTDATDEDFDRLFNLNVRAMFQLSREGARRMTNTGWGRIINTGSVFGHGAFEAGLSTYCGTKFAVQGLTPRLVARRRAAWDYGQQCPACVDPAGASTHERASHRSDEEAHQRGSSRQARRHR